MKVTASPTVVKFLTSSSGIFTSNFSSALTTMVIIEIESMSRSSVNDLSSATLSVAMPVSSLMSSARPARTSSVDSAMVILLSGSRQNAGCGVGRFEGPTSSLLGRSGEPDDLGAVHEPGAEADLQGETAREPRVLLEQ